MKIKRKIKEKKNVKVLLILLLLIIAAILLVVMLKKPQKIEKPSIPFCGFSTEGKCSSSNDCIVGGCSGQVCQSKKEARLITTCEWRDCYDTKAYGLECKCVNEKCQWR
ncbi:MAG: eight-cysteine-cluster domain-containing protein [Candidatus Pacearchaeota archaeon]